ncbi:acyl-CoA dehydrogenase [Pseudoclavibacter endophyticus]|uniref:acyl-CoA dehydrogenase family protein n=1 Tax=Pseudoclavibacter endophyticus TaxID=1778590 RepID=UPI0019C6E38D|nr:acyl-CoA dehydrogenase family protein [Pseudoclavibacter endophyticus]GGA74450.1 acyl-CoA dehydrogenase [Pseudoclavibacter endophyticus]
MSGTPGSARAALTDDEAADFFGFAGTLTDAERSKLAELRALLDERVRPHLADWWERAHTPVELRRDLAALRLEDDPALLADGDGDDPRPLFTGFKNFELARCDLSTAMLYGGQVSMFRTLVRQGGSLTQVREMDARIRSFDLTGCFALTEPAHGSDVARGLETTATRHGDGPDATWTITGEKRWIGNADASELLGVVAKDAADGRAKVFLVPRTAPGVELEPITGKMSLRIVRNSNIRLNDVTVREADRLQGIDSFADLARILGSLRADVVWFAAGMQAGALEAARRYAMGRAQFGRPIASYQLIQEKLARMLGNTTATLALAVSLTGLDERGIRTEAQAAMSKLWSADRLRETVALARETCGGEGITLARDVGRFFADAEALYTYEGTREINALIVGRELTGIGAFV